ncbi:MAG: carcinine hydrolase/isopenicillin-N N-acyltransferase family protein [Aristaeellaceae bacterium]
MKKNAAALVVLIVALVCLLSTACAENRSVNPHAAAWLNGEMSAALDTLTRVDEAGMLYEMHCDYDYYGNPVFTTLLEKFGAYDAGCSAFATWNETGDSFLTARNYDYRHRDPDGAYTGLNVAVRCAPEGKYKSVGIADACWLSLAGGAYYAGVLDDGRTDTSLAVLLPYLCVDGINEKGVTVSILKLDVRDGETAVDQQAPGKVSVAHSVLARYILDSCATVEEAIALAQAYNVRNTGGMDFHIFVTDATGASVVLEWRYQQLTVTDTNAVTNFYVGYDDAEDRYQDGVCTEKAITLGNTVREYRYGYGHGYHRFAGMVCALERYIDFTREDYVTRMTEAQAMRILSVAAQDPGTEATSMTQYSVIYNAQDASATVWLHQDYATAYRLTMD